MNAVITEEKTKKAIEKINAAIITIKKIEIKKMNETVLKDLNHRMTLTNIVKGMIIENTIQRSV